MFNHRIKQANMVMSSIHAMPIEEIEHLMETGKLTSTFVVDDFFITATFYKSSGHYYMEVTGLCGVVVSIHRSDTLVSLLLALVFDEVVYTPNVVESEKGGMCQFNTLTD